MSKAKIFVTLKEGVLDPQGTTVKHALDSLGFAGVEEVRIGKFMEISLKESSPDKARETVTDMCRKLLANTVIEDFRVEIE